MHISKDSFIGCTHVLHAVSVRFSHQQAIEKDVAKHPQTTDDEVDEVIEELEVHHHGLIASCEGSAVSNKTYQEDYFIANLKA